MYFQTFATYGLNKYWNVLSINHDWYGAEFISSLEHVKYVHTYVHCLVQKNLKHFLIQKLHFAFRYPFYGVQFHPEKVLYEFIPNRNITHTSQAVIASQYFADFFLNEVRKNRNHFANRTEEINALIYNYQPVYTGAKGSAFVQQYLFDTQFYGTSSGATKLHCLLALITICALGAWRRV